MTRGKFLYSSWSLSSSYRMDGRTDRKRTDAVLDVSKSTFKHCDAIKTGHWANQLQSDFVYLFSQKQSFCLYYVNISGLRLHTHVTVQQLLRFITPVLMTSALWGNVNNRFCLFSQHWSVRGWKTVTAITLMLMKEESNVPEGNQETTGRKDCFTAKHPIPVPKLQK